MRCTAIKCEVTGVKPVATHRLMYKSGTPSVGVVNRKKAEEGGCLPLWSGFKATSVVQASCRVQYYRGDKLQLLGEAMPNTKTDASMLNVLLFINVDVG